MDLQILDISNIDWDDHVRVEKLVAQLSESCETSGFFYLKIDEKFGQTCLQMLQAAKEVFKLPNDEKMKLVNDGTSQMFHKGNPIPGTGAGLRPRGHDPNFLDDLREIFNISIPILHEDDNADSFKQSQHTGNGKNKWPNPSMVNPKWRDVITDYANTCMRSCRILARLFAIALGQEPTYFEKPGFFDNPTCLLGMNFYHFEGEHRVWQDGDRYGIKPHMDSGIFTLLLTDGSQGLERCINRKTVNELTTHMERVWMPVQTPKPEEGLLIVNLGKNMDFWTGGRFKATLHRVVNKTMSPRHSVPFFYEPNMDAIINPILNTQDPIKEAEMKAYIKEKFGKNYIMPADLFYERLAERDNKNFDP